MSPTPTLSAWTLGLILFCVLAEIGTQLNFKAAADGARPDRPVASLLSQPLLWIGILLWAIEAVAWLLVLEHAPLAVAFPIMTLTYAGTPLAAGLVLGEELTRGQKVGAAMIAVGVMVVALSDLRPGA